MATVINIISGKGGTGKTLLTAVFAEMLGSKGENVLVVDLDVFVRGLTALLYYKRNKSLKIADSDCSTVSEFFKSKGELYDSKAYISKYSSFDVFPSVSSVVEKLNFRDVMPNSFDEAIGILKTMLESIPREYEFIFLDSRAGYDELIAASHFVSDFSICVEESDDISMITAKNLIAQLENDKNNERNKQIFRIKNKTRNTKRASVDDSSDVFYLGSIPFDTDVMDSFGTEDFWDDIAKSLYKEAAIEVWNNLADKMELSVKLRSRRISPLGSSMLDKRMSMLGAKNRILFVFGTIITTLSVMMLIYSPFFWDSWEGLFIDPFRLVVMIMALTGIFLVVYSVLRNNKN